MSPDVSLSPGDAFWSLAVYFHGVSECFHLICKILTSPENGPIRQPYGAADGEGESHGPGTLPVSPTRSPRPDQLPQGEAESALHSFLPLLQGLQEEGLDLGVQMEAMRALVQGNSHHQHRMDQLSSDHQTLHRSLEVRGQRRVCAVTETSDTPGDFLPLFFLRSFQPFFFFLPSFLPFLIHSGAPQLLSTSCMPGSVLGSKD